MNYQKFLMIEPSKRFRTNNSCNMIPVQAMIVLLFFHRWNNCDYLKVVKNYYLMVHSKYVYLSLSSIFLINKFNISGYTNYFVSIVRNACGLRVRVKRKVQVNNWLWLDNKWRIMNLFFLGFGFQNKLWRRSRICTSCE
jgi:hypothetical protein